MLVILVQILACCCFCTHCRCLVSAGAKFFPDPKAPPAESSGTISGSTANSSDAFSGANTASGDVMMLLEFPLADLLVASAVEFPSKVRAMVPLLPVVDGVTVANKAVAQVLMGRTRDRDEIATGSNATWRFESLVLANHHFDTGYSFGKALQFFEKQLKTEEEEVICDR